MTSKKNKKPRARAHVRVHSEEKKIPCWIKSLQFPPSPTSFVSRYSTPTIASLSWIIHLQLVWLPHQACQWGRKQFPIHLLGIWGDLKSHSNSNSNSNGNGNSNSSNSNSTVTSTSSWTTNSHYYLRFACSNLSSGISTNNSGIFITPVSLSSILSRSCLKMRKELGTIPEAFPLCAPSSKILTDTSSTTNPRNEVVVLDHQSHSQKKKEQKKN